MLIEKKKKTKNDIEHHIISMNFTDDVKCEMQKPTHFLTALIATTSPG